jgi:hypothetical protein
VQVRVLAADPVYEPQLSQQLFKAAFVACPAVTAILLAGPSAVLESDAAGSDWATLKARWVTLRDRWVTLKDDRWVTLRAR